MGLIYVSAIYMCLENILEDPLNRLLFFLLFIFLVSPLYPLALAKYKIVSREPLDRA